MSIEIKYSNIVIVADNEQEQAQIRASEEATLMQAFAPTKTKGNDLVFKNMGALDDLM